MKIIIVVIIGFFSCGTSEQEIVSNELKIKNEYVDTIGIGQKISDDAQSKRDSLQKNNSVAYAHDMLKKFAYCNCLYEAYKKDTFFVSIDRSNGLLARDLIIHSPDVIDSVRGFVKNYVDWINHTTNPFNIKNYSLFCIELYESKQLDSMVRRFNYKIMK